MPGGETSSLKHTLQTHACVCVCVVTGLLKAASEVK